MKKKVKVILPIYGLAKNVSQEANLSKDLLIRPIDLLKNEQESFKRYGIHNWLKGHFALVKQPLFIDSIG